MAYRCEVYCNTGFNAVDIPDDYYTLKNNFTPWITYDDIDLIQTEYLATLRLSDLPHEVARQVDYIVIEDPDVGPEGMKRCCYTVETFAYTSWDVVEFHLLLDAYNTFGGFKLETSGNEIISGFANRMSVSLEEDAANFYTLDEPFQPAERCTTEIYKLFEPGSGVKTLIETTTVPPLLLDDPAGDKLPDTAGEIYSNYGKSFESTLIGGMVTSVKDGSGNTSYSYSRGFEPLLRPLVQTAVGVPLPSGAISYVQNGTRYWNAANIFYKDVAIKGRERSTGRGGQILVSGSLIGDFHDADRDSDIINYWEVPANYIVLNSDVKYDPKGTAEAEKYGGISSCDGKTTASAQSITLPIGYNNKVKYSQSIMTKVYSPVSGESLDKKVYDICGPVSPDSASLSCPFRVCADIRPGGTPIFMWQYANNVDQTSFLTETLKGGAWRNLALTVEGYGESKKLEYDIKRDQEQRELFDKTVYGAGALMTGAFVGGTLNPMVGAGLAISGAKSLYGAYRQSQVMADEQELFKRQAVNASSQISIGNSNYARDCGCNTFFCVISKYSPNDLVSYDTFLTQYGYNVGNKRFENKDLFTRPAFNYVRINDLQVRSLSSNIDLFRKVKEQMKMGVRLWHKKPEVADMFPGGNR